MKKYFKILLTLSVLFIVAVGYGSKPVFAANNVSAGCAVTSRAYEPGLKFWDLNIQRTTNNLLVGIVINLYTHISGVDPDYTMKCQDYIIEKTSMLWDYPEDYVTCSAEGDPEIERMCAALTSDVGVGDISNQETMSEPSVLVDSVNSSMIGLGTMLEGAARREPVPVSFAYYWNQSVTKIPFAGKALAADQAYENLPVIKAVYSVWNFSLRVSLALLSLVLLYTGIMITMGKKISSQLVVSVQYAIPKIVIGTILIIFSYPIGAAITSVSFGLFKGAFPIVLNVLAGEGAGDLPSGILLLRLLVETLSIARGGTAYLIIAVIVLLLLNIAKWVIYLKVLLVYIKMAFSIVAAPFEFVLGTIPGNDDKMKDWFLRMAKYGITLFGMGLTIPITLWVGLEIMNVYMGSTVGGERATEVGGWGVAISLIAPVLIVIFGFGIGMSMEKRVDEMFSGKKKR